MPGPRPQLVALLICERAFQEAGSMKWHISGAFDTIAAAKLPITHPHLSVFVAMSDFSGDSMVQVVVRDEEGGVVKAVRGKIPRVPLGLFQYVFPIPEIEFKTAGVHTLELLADDDLIALRSFRVQNSSAQLEDEPRLAHELADAHRAELVKDAREVWADHPDARPVGLIVSAAAAEEPWFRQIFVSIFTSPPPQMTFVGILDDETALRILADKVPNAEDWLWPKPGLEGWTLPVVIVMRGSFQLAHLEVDRFE